MEIHRRLQRARATDGGDGPNLSTVRKALRGISHRRGMVETRGRKRILSPTNVRALNAARKRLIAKADGQYEVHWSDIIRAARVPNVDRSTAAKGMKAAGYDIRWRTPRQKLVRGAIDDDMRMKMCDKLRKKPVSFWTTKLDAIIDNTVWAIPRSVKGRAHLKKLRVRGHLRTKAEGLQKGFTKPDARKHRMNVGPAPKLFVAIIGCKVRVWHYLPRRWSGDAAAKVYRDVLAPALKRYRGEKRRYDILEDNDPAGYKAAPALAAKAALKIKPIMFPTYSPDLNPCDYALWDEVQRRMDSQPVPAQETIAEFKERLRRTALTIPARTVRKLVASMKTRTQDVYERRGGHIPRD